MKSSLLLAFVSSALLAGVSSAVIKAEALAPANASLATIEKRAVPDVVYNNLFWYYRYASSAYLNDCPRPNGNIRLKWFHDSGTDTQAFIAVDHRRKEIILAFRGTESAKDFWTDAQAFVTGFSVPWFEGPGNVRVHRGFLKAWNSIAVDVYQTIVDGYNADPVYSTYSITTVGHSLGGALASLAGVTLKHQFPNALVRIYTYGQPRTGNQAYANWLNTIIGLGYLFRSVNANDPVPHLPPYSTGYRHHGTEYWTSMIPPSAFDTFICPDNEDPRCSYGSPFTIADIENKPHRSYFGVQNGKSFCA